MQFSYLYYDFHITLTEMNGVSTALGAYSILELDSKWLTTTLRTSLKRSTFMLNPKKRHKYAIFSNIHAIFLPLYDFHITLLEQNGVLVALVHILSLIWTLNGRPQV